MKSFVVAADGLPHVKGHKTQAGAEVWAITQVRLNRAQWGCVLPTWAKYVARDTDGSLWAYACAPVLGPGGRYLSIGGKTLELSQGHVTGFPELFNLEA